MLTLGQCTWYWVYLCEWLLKWQPDLNSFMYLDKWNIFMFLTGNIWISETWCTMEMERSVSPLVLQQKNVICFLNRSQQKNSQEMMVFMVSDFSKETVYWIILIRVKWDFACFNLAKKSECLSLGWPLEVFPPLIWKHSTIHLNFQYLYCYKTTKPCLGCLFVVVCLFSFYFFLLMDVQTQFFVIMHLCMYLCVRGIAKHLNREQ